MIAYAPLSKFPGWEHAESFLASLVHNYGCRHILEIGSGANPTLTPTLVRQHSLTYVTSDISLEEMEKADPIYSRLALDLSSSVIDPSLIDRYDCVFSRMVGEHIQDGEQYHRNIHRILRTGGISAHCFSTLWCLPFAANRLLPEAMTDRLLNHFAPRDRHQHEKFRAHYSWSRGPTDGMIKRFNKLGFEIIEYTGYFGHGYYAKRLPWLHRLEMLKKDLLMRFPVPHLCSYATIILRKR